MLTMCIKSSLSRHLARRRRAKDTGTGEARLDDMLDGLMLASLVATSIA